jgi:hypothetical protein
MSVCAFSFCGQLKGGFGIFAIYPASLVHSAYHPVYANVLQKGETTVKTSNRIAHCIKGFIVGVVLVAYAATASPVYANGASPYEIYLYNAQGIPVDVTASYYTANGYVYSDATGDIIGIADYQKGHVYDMSGDDIGLLISNN